MGKLYISRKIRLGDEFVDEMELLKRAKLIVVLAEPGAGKTDFLGRLASLLGTGSVRASLFRTPSYNPPPGSLVIDAMDEVARVGETQLHDIVSKAAAHHTNTTVFASRSGEWENARTKFVEECFRIEPTIVRLEPFDSDEQRLLFEDEFPGENFDNFRTGAEQFDLAPLLGNPEFLKLFGYAYLENERKFSGKAQIYADAARRLAHDMNDGRAAPGRPAAAQIVDQAASIFARLLLAGASGVSKKQTLDDRNYPYGAVVSAEVTVGLDHLLDSKLFKPASDANEHEPVHRIIAEYLAARYLVGRICDATDRLSLLRCLSVIAPNNTVRDELRGMLGWMAALGDDHIQKAAIRIDPYAVLSNGDPAQLSIPNRLLLISQLQEASRTDPYFRRSDMWRTFNVGQFFSSELVSVLKPILAGRDSSHLRHLILELIDGTDVAAQLQPELEVMALDGSAASHERIAAFRLLLDIEGYKAVPLVDRLRAEGSVTSLRLVTELINRHGTRAIADADLSSFLAQLATLYPNGTVNGRRKNLDGMSRYFLKEFFRRLALEGIEAHLDRLTAGIVCICEPKRAYACHCCEGISKIVGTLLDRYFEAQPSNLEPARIWRWTKNLTFTRDIDAEHSAAVRELRDNQTLRQAIQEIAFSEGATKEEFHEIAFNFSFNRGHSGLRLNAEDRDHHLGRAFEADNVTLWETLGWTHNIYRDPPGPDLLRTRLRRDAAKKPAFMAAWHKSERAWRAAVRKERKQFSMRKKRYAQREAAIKAKNFSALNANRSIIEAGEHWGWLKSFAHDPPPLNGSTLKYGFDHEGGPQWPTSDTSPTRSSRSFGRLRFCAAKAWRWRMPFARSAFPN